MIFSHVYYVEEQMVKTLTEDRYSFWSSNTTLTIRSNIIIIIIIIIILWWLNTCCAK